MNRYTFVIHVHSDGPSTLENLNTNERVQVVDLAAVGSQIELWLEALHLASGTAVFTADGKDPPPTPQP
jgi:hypothetical protein